MAALRRRPAPSLADAATRPPRSASPRLGTRPSASDWPLVHAVERALRPPLPRDGSGACALLARATPGDGAEPARSACSRCPAWQRSLPDDPERIAGSCCGGWRAAPPTGSASTAWPRSTPRACSPNASAGRSWSSSSTPTGAWSAGSSAPRSPASRTSVPRADRSRLADARRRAWRSWPAHGRRRTDQVQKSLSWALREWAALDRGRAEAWLTSIRPPSPRPATAIGPGSSGTPPGPARRHGGGAIASACRGVPPAARAALHEPGDRIATGSPGFCRP